MSSAVDTARQMLAVLGLRPGATLVEIKQARTDLVKVWHPDRFSHDARLRVKAGEKLKEINAAYEWLCSHPEALRSEPKTSATDSGESFHRTASDSKYSARPHMSGRPPHSKSQSRHPSPKSGLSEEAKRNLMGAGLLVFGIGWLALMVSIMGYASLILGPLIAYAVYKVVKVFR